MAEKDKRGGRGWFRRGGSTERTQPEPDRARGTTKAAAGFDDPWSAEAWSEDGWDDDWTDPARRASVRPAAEPRAADVDAWLESDQTQFADVTADMARKWAGTSPAPGATWDEYDDGLDTPDTPGAAYPPSDIAASDAAYPSFTTASLTEETDAPSEPVWRLPTFDTTHVGTDDSTGDATQEIGAELGATDAESPGPWRLPTFDTPTPLADADTEHRTTPPDGEHSMVWTLPTFDPPSTENADSTPPATSSAGDDGGFAFIDHTRAPNDAVTGTTVDPDVDGDPDMTPGLSTDDDAEARVDALLAADPGWESGATTTADTPTTWDAQGGWGSDSWTDTEAAELASDGDLDATPSGGVSRFDEDLDDLDDEFDDDLDDDLDSVHAHDGLGDGHGDTGAAPDRAMAFGATAPGATWDDSNPTTHTAYDDEFTHDVDRSIETELADEFGLDSPWSRHRTAASADAALTPDGLADTKPNATADTYGYADTALGTVDTDTDTADTDGYADADADADATGAEQPWTGGSTAASQLTTAASSPGQATAIPNTTRRPTRKKPPRTIAASTAHRSGAYLADLLLTAGTSVAVVGALRFGGVLAATSRADGAPTLAHRLGDASLDLGPVHGILALLAVAFVALGTAFARRRSARQEMLAGWACGVTLATSLGGFILSVLAVRNGLNGDDAIGSVLADFAGQGLLCATAAWTAWRATAPEPRRFTKAASATN